MTEQDTQEPDPRKQDTRQPGAVELDVEAIRSLARELEKLNSHRFIRVQNSLWRLILFQFTRGLAFGLGSVLGATILVSIVAWWVSQFEFLPIIGEWANQLVEEIQDKQGP
ncbi:hypothetical protein SAMN04490248_12339 [Salinihabitans flavidus]|uniref:Uncharacterized protein n=1 Tax=Salinihabitans flavidus TaxID=569882 RepID=A0A1H8UY74_9RHOB|nr:DUF5665 domain-containing protein [Salinihabitans flavidus]SEP08101.1 hypothetical protein SAMN04490248_12339 [Salinihabitans flavidus]